MKRLARILVDRRYLFAASLGGLFAWAAYLLADSLLHAAFLSNLLAAAFSVFYAEALARLLKTPATLFLTTAILPLVPGGSLYETMSHAVRGEMELVRSCGNATLSTALAIAVGISIVLAIRELRTRRQ